MGAVAGPALRDYTVAHPAMRASAILLVAALLPATAHAAKLVTVDQIQQILAASQGRSDAQLADEISSLEATERIDTPTLLRWQTATPGSRSRDALLLLADSSAFLPLPPSQVLAQPAPDGAALNQMVMRTINYLGKALPNLPNFMAARNIAQFEDSPLREQMDIAAFPDAHQHVHSIDAAQLVVGKPYFLPLYESGRKTLQVTYRSGHEIQVNLAKNDVDAGLRSRGEFGPVLAVVIGDALHQKLFWDHWQQGVAGRLATFRYVVSVEASHNVVEYPSDSGVRRIVTPYHGEFTVDPGTGAVLRLTIIADMPPPYEHVQSALVVEYGPVVLGNRTYICPLRSVSLAREPLAGESEASSPTLRTFLNDVSFTDYHLFHADARIIGSAHAAGSEPPPQPR